MPKCKFCDHDNPAGIGRCQNCGAWVEQGIEATPTQSGQPAPAPADVGPEPDGLEDVLALMKGGKKIEAIKLYRAKTGADLKDAKDAVEALAAKHGISSKGSGCAGAVLLMLLSVLLSGLGLWLLQG